MYLQLDPTKTGSTPGESNIGDRSTEMSMWSIYANAWATKKTTFINNNKLRDSFSNCA